ncbi:MAG: metallophosphoesterase [Clostridia bacterium]|nr:metallophosphoesterase [Clostridia bacterium]
MKTFKRVLAVVLSLVMVLSLTCTAFAGSDYSTPSMDRLKFDSKGNFRILQLADCQDGMLPRYGMIEFIKKALEKYKPDLVVFTGDNTGAIGTEFEAKLAIEAIVEPVEAAGVPFTFVFGNHDAENVSKEYHYSIYQSFSNCMAYDADPDMYGMGTHNLPIYASDNSKVVFNLWMFDSNMYNEELGGYDHIHEDQLQWYVDASNVLKEQNGGEPVPSIAFQHIVPNEIMDYVIETETADPNGFTTTNKETGETHHYALDPEYAEKGSVLQERPCPGTVDSMQMELFAQQGDVLGVFFGHDHVNDYIVNTTLKNAKGESIDLVNTPGATFSSYGNEQMRGCRIIDISEKDTWTYKTESFTFFDVMGDTEETRIMSYFSREIGWWYVAKVLEFIPEIGPALAEGFLKLVYTLAHL